MKWILFLEELLVPDGLKLVREVRGRVLGVQRPEILVVERLLVAEDHQTREPPERHDRKDVGALLDRRRLARREGDVT